MQVLQEETQPALNLKESALAHRYLDGLRGVEIGGSTDNPLGLNTVKINNTPNPTESKTDVVSEGDELPLATGSVDFVLTSHVLESCVDPISALKDWHRVVKNGGYIFAVVYDKEKMFYKDRPRTPLAELIARHKAILRRSPQNGFSVWTAEDVVDLIGWLGWRILEVQSPDERAGNEFTVVIKVQKEDIAPNKHMSVPELEFLVDYAVGRDIVPIPILLRMMDRMALSADRQHNGKRQGII
jgi:SAM-dependent methyltransferase